MLMYSFGLYTNLAGAMIHVHVTSNNIWYLPIKNAKLVAEKCKIGC